MVIKAAGFRPATFVRTISAVAVLGVAAGAGCSDGSRPGHLEPYEMQNVAKAFQRVQRDNSYIFSSPDRSAVDINGLMSALQHGHACFQHYSQGITVRATYSPKLISYGEPVDDSSHYLFALVNDRREFIGSAKTLMGVHFYDPSGKEIAWMDRPKEVEPTKGLNDFKTHFMCGQ